MKKSKLSLDELQVKSFSTSVQQRVHGGAESDGSLCESVNWCQTLDYSACHGEYQCGIWQRTRNC
ncbi:MAG: pinensin family lanthipeptide [Cyclobacteriaceae bacterium]